MAGVFEQQLIAHGKMFGRIDQEIDDGVVIVLQNFAQVIVVHRIGLLIADVRGHIVLFVQGHHVHLAAHIGQKRNQVSAHGTGSAQNQDLLPFMLHGLFSSHVVR